MRERVEGSWSRSSKAYVFVVRMMAFLSVVVRSFKAWYVLCENGRSGIRGNENNWSLEEVTQEGPLIGTREQMNCLLHAFSIGLNECL